jgi:hypothetical protein
MVIIIIIIIIIINLLGLRRVSILLILLTVGRSPWTGEEPVSRPLPTHRTTET